MLLPARPCEVALVELHQQREVGVRAPPLTPVQRRHGRRPFAPRHSFLQRLQLGVELRRPPLPRPPPPRLPPPPPRPSCHPPPPQFPPAPSPWRRTRPPPRSAPGTA